MAEHVTAPEWRAENADRKYPFADGASLRTTDGRELRPGTLLDAAIHPVGGGVGAYLAAAEVDHERVTLRVGVPGRPNLCAGTFPLIGAGGAIPLADARGRPAGLLVSEAAHLGIFQSWGVGTHTFTPQASEFAAGCCVPTPEVGVRGLVLPDGTVLAGDAWLVGGDGVVLSWEPRATTGGCGQVAGVVHALRVDVVGDPLFRRRLCVPQSLFQTPRFIRQVRFEGPGGVAFTCTPDAAGNILLTINNALAADTVLRLIGTVDGLEFAAVGGALGA